METVQEGAKRRKRLSGSLSVRDLVAEMSEGNPGSINVMMTMLETDDSSLLDLLHMDDMNIRGCQIWAAYKNFANCDLAVMKAAVRRRDQALIDVVNRECRYIGEIAVRSGASFR